MREFVKQYKALLIVACVAIILSVVVIVCCATRSNNSPEVTEPVSIAMETVSEKNDDTLTEKQEAAKKQLKCAELYKAPNRYGVNVFFDTYSGVMYMKYVTSSTNAVMVTLYQKDGTTPRNMYTENTVYSTEERAQFLLDNYWDVL